MKRILFFISLLSLVGISQAACLKKLFSCCKRSNNLVQQMPAAGAGAPLVGIPVPAMPVAMAHLAAAGAGAVQDNDSARSESSVWVGGRSLVGYMEEQNPDLEIDDHSIFIQGNNQVNITIFNHLDPVERKNLKPTVERRMTPEDQLAYLRIRHNDLLKLIQSVYPNARTIDDIAQIRDFQLGAYIEAYRANHQAIQELARALGINVNEPVVALPGQPDGHAYQGPGAGDFRYEHEKQRSYLEQQIKSSIEQLARFPKGGAMHQVIVDEIAALEGSLQLLHLQDNAAAGTPSLRHSPSSQRLRADSITTSPRLRSAGTTSPRHATAGAGAGDDSRQSVDLNEHIESLSGFLANFPRRDAVYEWAVADLVRLKNQRRNAVTTSPRLRSAGPGNIPGFINNEESASGERETSHTIVFHASNSPDQGFIDGADDVAVEMPREESGAALGDGARR